MTKTKKQSTTTQVQTDFDGEMPEPDSQKKYTDGDEGEQGIIGREKSHGEIAEMLVDYSKHLWAIGIITDQQHFVMVNFITWAAAWKSKRLFQYTIAYFSTGISRGGQGRKDIQGPYEKKTEEKKLQKLAGKVEGLNL